jgi:uncharacterized protein YndB with AHSA1/START domain
VTVELRGDGSETELTLTHDRLPPGEAESHRDGWGAILDNLEALLAEQVHA